MAFKLPAPAKLNKVQFALSVAAGANFDVVLYDSDGTTVLATASHDGDVTAQTGAGTYEFVLGSDVTLAASTLYRVTIQPTTTNNVTIRYMTFDSAALMATAPGGDEFYMTSQIGEGGTWTDYNASSPGFRRPQVALHLTEIDDGAGGGSGGFPVLGGPFT